MRTESHFQEKRIELTKNEGNEIVAVSLVLGKKPIRSFEDSRLADSIIANAFDILEKVDNGLLNESDACEAF
jgi:hypothetical protein